MKRNYFPLFSIALLLVLLITLVVPFSVFAQDQTPPPVDSPVVEVSPIQDAPSLEESVKEVVISDTLLADESTPLESSAEVLEQLPEKINLLVVDENGEVLPLTSQVVAEAFAAGADPYFIGAGGIVYGYTAFGGVCPSIVDVCSETANPIQVAINNFVAKSGSGNITVEAGTYTENITINAIANLTGLIGAGSASTILDGSVSITGMANAFVFSGFHVYDADGSGNATGVSATSNINDLQLADLVVTNTAGSGISVENHTGDVTLTDVNSSKNNGYGAFLNNTDGFGNITLKGTNIFDENGSYGTVWFGIVAQSHGDITFSNTSASRNLYFGSNLYNVGGTGNITMTGTNAFDNNGQYGLIAYTSGNITLSNISASGNAELGAMLDNSAGTEGITLTGTNIFNSNGLYGLSAYSNGNISLGAITANGNGDNGIQLFLSSNMTMNCGSVVTNNDLTGIKISSFGSTLTLNEVTVSGNGTDIDSDGYIVNNSGGCGGNQEAAPQIVAIITPYSESDLPGSIPENNLFVTGMNISLFVNGQKYSVTSVSVEVKINIPTNAQNKTLAVLFWDGEKWIVLNSIVINNQIQFNITQSGIYALVIIQ